MRMKLKVNKAMVIGGAVACLAAAAVPAVWASSDNAPAVTIPAATIPPTTAPAAATNVAPATAPTTAPTTQPSAGSSSGTAGSSSGLSNGSASSGESGTAGSQSSGGGASAAKKSGSHTKAGSGSSAGQAAPSSSAFIGQISGSNVNVRSGPGLRYYIVGQLTSGDLVNVVKTTKGWDVISAPAGARCYVAKQFVKLNASGTRGTITSRFVNLRAASALTPTSDYSVVGIARRGQRVSVVGHSGMFYIIRAPMHTHFYVYASFVKPAPANSTYISPQLQMPPEFKGTAIVGLAPSSAVAAPSAPAGGAAATNAPPVAIPAPSGGPAAGGSTAPAAAAVTPSPIGGAALKPVPTYNPKAYTQFAQLDKALLVQFKKPLLQRKLKKLDAEFKTLLKEKNLPHSIRSATKLRIKEINRMMAIQALAATPAAEAPVTATIAPYQQQWEQSKKILEKSIATAPFVAKGMLETSHTTHQYALLNPNSGRVVAYIQPPSDMDLSKLVGSYVGIKGLVVSKTGAFIRVIKPNSATLLPNPNP
jgi:uncharacterized protein YraI